MRAALAFAASLALASCSSGSKVADEGRRIRIFYNNDNFAYLESCGCRVSPIGGMDRRWNAMKAYPDDTRIFLDAGNLLFKGREAAELLAPQWYEQAAAVIEAYNLLGADAATVGETDLALGVEKFQELAAKAKFPFLSANVHRKGSGELLLRDSVMIHRQGRKIGVFGLFGPALRLPSSLEARDPLDAAGRMVAKLRAQGADMVVALTHQGYDADVQLARKVPGIHLIVGAHSQSLLQKPDEEGRTLIVQLSSEGQMLGMVEYDAAELPRRRTSFVVAELNDEFREGPKDVANPMKSLISVTNLRIQEVNRALDEKIWSDRYGQAPASAPAFDTYLSCRDCHAKQAGFHAGKPHSAAFFTLLAKHKERDLDCVKCHSVGLGQKGGFHGLADAFRDGEGRPVSLAKVRASAGPGFPRGPGYREDPGRLAADVAVWDAALRKNGVRKAFVSVQCESCHGTAAGHPFAAGRFQPARISTCLQCHTREQAPAWYGKDGKLLEARAKAKLDEMRCPR